MATPENTFIAGVHRYLPAMDVLYRMKNHNVYNGGIADMWYSGNRGDLWVEYKFIAVPKRDDTVIDLVSGKSPILSALQQNWLAGRCEEGRGVAVLVGCKEGGVWFPGTSWRSALSAQEFRKRLLSRSELASIITSITV